MDEEERRHHTWWRCSAHSRSVQYRFVLVQDRLAPATGPWGTVVLASPQHRLNTANSLGGVLDASTLNPQSSTRCERTQVTVSCQPVGELVGLLAAVLALAQPPVRWLRWQAAALP